ncbi:hypothetical protein ACQ4PT_028138 [Festuca glaucescens]
MQSDDIAWGKRTRVVLDDGCCVASFCGYLFDGGVVTMSPAPKDENEAQVQMALERNIPAISAVMGSMVSVNQALACWLCNSLKNAPQAADYEFFLLVEIMQFSEECPSSCRHTFSERLMSRLSRGEGVMTDARRQRKTSSVLSGRLEPVFV